MTVIDEAKEYVEALFRSVGGSHDAAHTLRVYRTAMLIAEKEKNCDPTAVALAALLHDADDPKLFGTENNQNARSFLGAHDVDAETAEKVVRAVNEVSFSKNRFAPPETREGCIVRDADRLDAIGAVGIARTFAYGGERGRGLDDSIRHFHEKLLLLRDGMITPTAREMAGERHRFMLLFLEEYGKETLRQT